MDPCDRYSALASAWLFLATAAVSLVFLTVPALDVALSTAFYLPDSPFGPFPDRFDPGLGLLRAIGMRLPAIIMALLAVVLLLRIIFPTIRLPVRAADAFWLLTSAALASGLIVESLFKSVSGRARPRDIVEFGGSQDFSMPWVISDGCAKNCSFMSGEASAAFWLIALACLLPRDLRLPGAVVILFFACLVSFNRVVFGAHFLSDVAISGLLTLAITAAIRAIFNLPALRPYLTGDALDHHLSRIGRALRGNIGGSESEGRP